MQKTWLPSVGGEDPPEKEMATNSSILAWKIPRTEELLGYSTWTRKDLDMTECMRTHTHTHTHTHILCDTYMRFKNYLAKVACNKMQLCNNKRVKEISKILYI